MTKDFHSGRAASKTPREMLTVWPSTALVVVHAVQNDLVVEEARLSWLRLALLERLAVRLKHLADL